MTAMSRRTTLAMLGLAPATAVGAETFLPSVGKVAGPQAGVTTGELMASAFRKMAENIEAGRVSVVGFDLSCSINPDAIVEHTLSTRFWYEPEKA